MLRALRVPLALLGGSSEWLAARVADGAQRVACSSALRSVSGLLSRLEREGGPVVPPLSSWLDRGVVDWAVPMG